MTAPELLATLEAMGATVQAVEVDRLRIEAPVGRLTPELRAALMAQKPALLALLREVSAMRSVRLMCAGCGSLFLHEPAGLCYRCRRQWDGRPLGPPCPGCGEACEDCLGTPDGRHRGAA
jgi:hypothetical protein